MKQRPKYLWSIPLIFFGVLFYFPLFKIVDRGFEGSWFHFITSGATLKIIWFTVWQAAISATIAILLGLPGAYVLYRCSFPGQRAIRALITVPFMLPTIVVAIGFTEFHRMSVITTIISANVFMNYSLAVRIIGGTWANLSRDIDEAAAIDGAGRLQTFIKISWPGLKGASASAFSLIYLYCAANFGIVLVLGNGSTNTIETAIYTNATQYLDLSKATSLVLAQTVLTILVFSIAWRLSKNPISIVGFAKSKDQKRLDRRDSPAFLLTLVVLILISVPIIGIISKSFSNGLTNYRALTSTGQQNFLTISIVQALENALRNALIVMVLSLTIGLIISFLLSKSSPIFSRLGEIIFQIPLGVSSVVLGLGYLLCFSSGVFPLRSSWLITPIAQSLLAIPLVVRLIYPAIHGIDAELIEAAALDSASSGDTWWLIELPAIKNILLISMGYAAIISIGDFGTANFLAYGQQGTVTTVLYQLISKPGSANYGMAMATSSILILITFILVGAISY